MCCVTGKRSRDLVDYFSKTAAHTHWFIPLNIYYLLLFNDLDIREIGRWRKIKSDIIVVVHYILCQYETELDYRNNCFVNTKIQDDRCLVTYWLIYYDSSMKHLE